VGSFFILCVNFIDIAEYMRNQKGPATKSQSGLKELQGQMKKDDITVVGFFDDTSDKRFDVYESFSKYIFYCYRSDFYFLIVNFYLFESNLSILLCRPV